MTKIYTTPDDDNVIYPIFAIFAYLKNATEITNLISSDCISSNYYNHSLVDFLKKYNTTNDKFLFNLLKLKVPNNILTDQTIITWKSYITCKGYGRGKNITKTVNRRKLFIETAN